MPTNAVTKKKEIKYAEHTEAVRYLEGQASNVNVGGIDEENEVAARVSGVLPPLRPLAVHLYGGGGVSQNESISVV